MLPIEHQPICDLPLPYGLDIPAILLWQLSGTRPNAWMPVLEVVPNLCRSLGGLIEG